MSVRVDVGRNERCACGSGKKYKHCCASKAKRLTRGQLALVALVAVLLVGGLMLSFSGRVHDGQPTGVWSEEHGHYH